MNAAVRFAGRLARGLLTVALVMTFSFVVLRLAGDPARVLLPSDTPPDAIEAFRRAWSLDQPIWRQYLDYVAHVVRFDFGVSMRDRNSVTAIIAEALPITLSLMAPAFLLKLLIGIPAGVAAALFRGKLVDRVTMGLSVVGFSVPSFVLGLLFVYIFSVRLKWLPSLGDGTARHFVLPILTLGLIGAGVLARFTRSAMMEVLGRPFVRASLAWGLPWRQIALRYVLPNALISLVTIIGLMLGGIVAGAIITEKVFNIHGIGFLLVDAVSNRDLPIVQALMMLICVCMVLANLVTDGIYLMIDPRLRSRGEKTDAV